MTAADTEYPRQVRALQPGPLKVRFVLYYEPEYISEATMAAASAIKYRVLRMEASAQVRHWLPHQEYALFPPAIG
eukprot:3880630-Pyramimonas_sp.AAC.1